MNRRLFLLSAASAVIASVASGIFARQSWAHHGWGWATDEEFELTGKITKVMLGNPHGELHLDVNGESWMVEIGQPWRNERAGLTEDLLAIGTEVTVHGHRSIDPDEKLMKAERLIIEGKDYNLYPDRES
jgi:membrane protein implicated in regulation of membrane protease activity